MVALATSIFGADTDAAFVSIAPLCVECNVAFVPSGAEDGSSLLSPARAMSHPGSSVMADASGARSCTVMPVLKSESSAGNHSIADMLVISMLSMFWVVRGRMSASDTGRVQQQGERVLAPHNALGR